MKEALADEVVGALGLDGPDAERVLGGRVAKVWRATCRGGPVAVRQSPWFRSEEEVRYECRLLTELRSQGAPVVRPVAGPVTAGGLLWVVFEWAEGRHPEVPVEDPHRYGALLARLHGLTAPLAERFGQRRPWGRVDQYLTLPRGDGSTCLADLLPEFEAAWGAVGTRLRRFAEEVHARLLDGGAASLPAVVAHGDFGPHQVLHGAGGPVVLDWDFCHLDSALADLAIATSLARPTADRAEAMLRGYLEAAAVEPGGLRLLGDLRRAFHLNNLGNQVCALWAHGIDVTPQIEVIAERLEREQWWDPLLRSAGAAVGRAECPDRPDRRPPPSTDLELAHGMADDAARIAMHFWESGVEAETKDDRSPVTDADRAVERFLREVLAAARPHDAVLGEEFGEQAGDHALGGRTWILDPIDGTASFARGEPHWRVQIALREGDDIVLALVDEPALGRRWWATRGGGTFERTADHPTARRLHVSHAAVVGEASVAFFPAPVGDRLPPHQPMQPRSPLPLVELIRGEVDAFYVECCQIWDHAPWVLLVQEAGGAFTDHEGGTSPDRRGGLYSNGRIHAELLAGIRR